MVSYSQVLDLDNASAAGGLLDLDPARLTRFALSLFLFRQGYAGEVTLATCFHAGGNERAHDGILRLGRQVEAIVDSGTGVQPLLPELVAASAGMNAAQSQDIFGARRAPEHAGLLATGADYGFTAGLDDPGTDEQALPTKGPVLHSFDIVNEVAQFLVNLLRLRLADAFGAGFLE